MTDLVSTTSLGDLGTACGADSNPETHSKLFKLGKEHPHPFSGCFLSLCALGLANRKVRFASI